MSASVPAFDVTFVNEQLASAYDCGICLQKLTEPVAACDDHIFCQSCINRLVESQRSLHFPCPSCRKECHLSRVRRVQFVDRRMKELEVRCPNFEITARKALYLSQRNQNNARIRHGRNPRNGREAPNEERARSRSRSRERNENQNQEDRNENENENKNADDEEKMCRWTGNWSDLSSHIASCELHMVQCQHCPSEMMRREQADHVRTCGHVPIPCLLCHKPVKRAHMNSHVENWCPSKVVPCQLCNQRMVRMRMRVHLRKSCPEKVTFCKYKDYGCTVRMRRRLLAEHERQMVSEHLTMVESAHGSLKDENDELEGRLSELEGSQEEMQAKMDDLDEEVREMKEELREMKQEIQVLWSF